MTTAEHRVVGLVVGRVSPFEVAVACEVFGLRRPEISTVWYDFVLAAEQAQVDASGIFMMSVAHGLEAVAEADTVVVPSAPIEGPVSPAVLDALRGAHARGARIVSYCSGAFALAEAGLLDGRRATTHWVHAERFRERFPRVDLDPDALYVDAGRILTSAGTSAAIDVSLHLVRRDHGAEIANAVARRMVVPPHRDGDQAQYVASPVPACDDRFAALLDWLRDDPSRDATVEEMAAKVHMSPRSFARRFRDTTGTTPHRWLILQRLDRARELLEGSELPVETVADRVGFGSASTLRIHFKRELGTSPVSYRRRFSRGQQLVG